MTSLGFPWFEGSTFQIVSLELRELVLSRHHDGLSDGNLLSVELLESVNAGGLQTTEKRHKVVKL